MFQIAGTQVAEPAHEGVVITDEPVWASNTGRAQTGKMTGSIRTWKRTVQVTWPPLPFDKSQQIRQLIKNNSPFFNITFNDVALNSAWPTQTVDGVTKPKTDQTVTMKVYCANIPRTIYSMTDAYPWHTGMTITFIEQ